MTKLLAFGGVPISSCSGWALSDPLLLTRDASVSLRLKLRWTLGSSYALTGLPLVTGWIPGEGLGCKVTRPKVELDALHTLHYNHQEIFKVYALVGIYNLVCLGISGLMCSPWIMSATISGIKDIVHQINCGIN